MADLQLASVKEKVDETDLMLEQTDIVVVEGIGKCAPPIVNIADYF